MKKKLQLKKEIVSILDRNQMNNLTKGGAFTDAIQCTTADTLGVYCTVLTGPNQCGGQTFHVNCGLGTEKCGDTNLGCNLSNVNEECKTFADTCGPQPQTQEQSCQATACALTNNNVCVTKDGCYCAASKDTCIG